MWRPNIFQQKNPLGFTLGWAPDLCVGGQHDTLRVKQWFLWAIFNCRRDFYWGFYLLFCFHCYNNIQMWHRSTKSSGFARFAILLSCLADGIWRFKVGAPQSTNENLGFFQLTWTAEWSLCVLTSFFWTATPFFPCLSWKVKARQLECCFSTAGMLIFQF